MDIEPTSVDVKAIIILDAGSYGGDVTIQVLGHETATAPLRVPLKVLQDLADDIKKIDPLLSSGMQNVHKPVMGDVVRKSKNNVVS